jgi:hypothetical protein
MKRTVAVIVALIAASSVHAQNRSRSVREPAIPSAWITPACESVSGLPGLHIGAGDADLISGNDADDPTNTQVLVALTDVPNRMVALLGNRLFESTDAGCLWHVRTGLTKEFTGIVRAPGSRAYAWSSRHDVLLRIWPAAVDYSVLPEAMLAVGVDPNNGQHLIAISKTRAYESANAGLDWTDNGRVPFAALYVAAVDPRDVRHVAIGGVDGSLRSNDGGLTWNGDGLPRLSTFGLAFAADGDGLWILTLDFPKHANVLYRSDVSVLSSGPKMTDLQFSNGMLSPNPDDASIVAFRSWGGVSFFDLDFGTVRTRASNYPNWDSVTWSPASGIVYLTAHLDVGRILGR